ncbi:ABC transporter permease [Paenibacillus validus]|uniref:ABC transporter permease subunit n=1 Tax=Paenibacillus validus TaxID=44253 RepID=A0A7X2Z9Q7_9BACL|nr:MULTISPECIES: ABC transporter permease [Paenibacillus]MED4599956.1 ABC transporter permease [Paenibacillus validus]MED4605872.1 ABC transporter permease [Paenibacillus validus]MUG70950.1 ABC transporter permease subunit [Paenibacillus validus]
MNKRKQAIVVINHVLNNRLTCIGLILVLVWVVLAVLAPWVAPYLPNEPQTADKLLPPNAAHWFGTDNYGRDIFSRIVYGAQVTVWTGFVSVGIAFFIGVPLGAIAGYFGGRSGNIIMRIMDTLLAFPSLILAMAIAASIGPGLFGALLAVGIVGIPEFARLMYGQTVVIKEREFIEASRALGVRHSAILFGHIFPNAFAPLLVQVTLGLGSAVLTTASLSFLGLGVRPPTAEWGAMISHGRDYIISGEWWMTVFPGIAIATTILGFNLLGDGLRDILDPHSRSSKDNKFRAKKE